VLRFDHVIMAVRDLDAASARLLDDHGLASVEGGRHAGHGTANRLVPLGRDYVELVAVVDPAEAGASEFGRWVADHSAGEALAGLCLRTCDMNGLGQRLGLSPVTMTRTRPDGMILSWRLLALAQALREGLPFFIEWDVPPEEHPGKAAAGHRVTPTGIGWVELGGDVERLAAWLGPHDLDLRVVDGYAGVHRVGLATDTGELIL
jgi:hypothetical protein